MIVKNGQEIRFHHIKQYANNGVSETVKSTNLIKIFQASRKECQAKGEQAQSPG